MFTIPSTISFSSGFRGSLATPVILTVHFHAGSEMFVPGSCHTGDVEKDEEGQNRAHAGRQHGLPPEEAASVMQFVGFSDKFLAAAAIASRPKSRRQLFRFSSSLLICK
jgi:hypothetical protein